LSKACWSSAETLGPATGSAIEYIWEDSLF
jgi:hypothetical protein